MNWKTVRREERGKVLIGGEGTDLVTQQHIDAAVGEGGAGDAGCLLWYRRDGLRAQRHGLTP